MTEAEETVDDLNIKNWYNVFPSLTDEAKTFVDVNISAEHNRPQSPC
jgi:hypothetical protein